MRKYIQTHVLLFIALTLVIWLPLLLGGYILTLDLVFAPHIDLPREVSSTYVLDALLSLTSMLLQAQIVEKILLCFVTLGMGLAAYYFVAYISGSDAKYRVHSLFAGVLYIFNPFVYSRCMSGQYLVLLGYMLIPLFVVALLRFLTDLSWRRAGVVLIYTLLISIVSIHTIGLLIVVSVPLIALSSYRHRKDWQWQRRVIAKSLGVVGAFIAASSYWLIPTLRGHGKTAEAVEGFRASDFAAFATGSDPLGTLGNVLAMQGFWADGANLYLTPQDIYWWWYIPLCIVVAIVLIGVYRGWRTLRGVTIAFIGMFVVAVVLSTGTQGSIFAPINEWLVMHVPFFAGYREPQKFVAVIVLVYVLFASLGVQQIILWLSSRVSRRLLIGGAYVFLLLPVACAPLMPWGFSGQLRASNYPRDWYSMNDYFEQHATKDDMVLALPWHMYMRFEFAGRIIANPMDKFFMPRLIMNNDPEFKGARSYAGTDEQLAIKRMLERDKGGARSAANTLRRLGVRYVLIAKEFDYRKYEYLQEEKGLRLVRDSESLQLYEIEPDTME